MSREYPEYKDTRISWAPTIPAHWGTVAIKHLSTGEGACFIDGDWIESTHLSESGIRYLTTGNVGEGRYKEQGSGFISEETFAELRCTEVFPGDILISRLNLPAGRACIVPNLDNRIVTAVDNVIVRPNAEFDKRYLIYLFSSPDYFFHTENLARGATMQRISRSQLGNIRIPLPASFEEQATIADYLDTEVGRLDSLITEKQNFIDLLKEKRQALISHFVTKGLDDNVPMKDSGVEWMGEIPSTWSVQKIGWDFKARKGSRAAELTKDYCGLNSGIYPVFSGQTSNNGVMGSIDSYEFDFEDSHVLFSTTVGAKAMHISILSGKFSLSQNCMIFYTDNLNIDTRFMFYHLQPLFKYERGLIPDHMQASFRMEDLYTYKYALPSLENQKAIAEYLDKESEKIDCLVHEINCSIDLLKEHRSALISAAVTGKIDVRGFDNKEVG